MIDDLMTEATKLYVQKLEEKLLLAETVETSLRQTIEAKE